MFEDLPYRSEYAKRATNCKNCNKEIDRKSLRLAKIVPSFTLLKWQTESNWHHHDCFFEIAEPKGPEEIECFEYLRFEDQRKILDSIAGVDPDEHQHESKVPKFDDQTNGDELSVDEKLKTQSDDLYFYIDKLFGKQELDKRFEIDLDAVSRDSFKQIYYIADSLLFGKPKKCPDCSMVIRFKLGKYVCTDNYCSYSTEDPERELLRIPEELKQKKAFSFLKNFITHDESRKRVSDPILAKCFELRRKQVIDSINVDQVKTVSSEVYRSEPDPCFDLESVRILEDDDGSSYIAILTKVDIFENVNSYCKIQLLTKDDGGVVKYWTCMVTGGIGTTAKKIQRNEYTNEQRAIDQFEWHFRCQTDQYWNLRYETGMVPNKFFYLNQDIDANWDRNIPVYLPFGMLTKARLQLSLSMLIEISKFGQVNFDNVREFTKLWNKFYTLFPQSFGTVQDARPALISDLKLIEKKVEIIDNLINCFYKLTNKITK